MKQTSVLVTGAGGFIGSNVMNQLNQAYSLTGVDNFSNGSTKFLSEDVKARTYFYDFTNESVLKWIADGRFDVIVHLAAIPRVSYSVFHPLETHETNVNKTLRLLDAAKGNVKRFIFASSSSVYGGAQVLPTPEHTPSRPASPYALQKFTVEEYARLYSTFYGLDTVSLRFFNVFGPNQLGSSAYACAIASWLTAVKRGESLRSDGDGSQSRDLCYVDNVVSAISLAIDCPNQLNGEAINIACGQRTTNNDILMYLHKYYKELGVNINIRTHPPRAGDVKHTHAHIAKAKNLLNYEPKVQFWDGLNKTIAWYDTNWDTFKHVQLSL